MSDAASLAFGWIHKDDDGNYQIYHSKGPQTTNRITDYAGMDLDDSKLISAFPEVTNEESRK